MRGTVRARSRHHWPHRCLRRGTNVRSLSPQRRGSTANQRGVGHSARGACRWGAQSTQHRRIIRHWHRVANCRGGRGGGVRRGQRRGRGRSSCYGADAAAPSRAEAAGASASGKRRASGRRRGSVENWRVRRFARAVWIDIGGSTRMGHTAATITSSVWGGRDATIVAVPLAVSVWRQSAHAASIPTRILLRGRTKGIGRVGHERPAHI